MKLSDLPPHLRNSPEVARQLGGARAVAQPANRKREASERGLFKRLEYGILVAAARLPDGRVEQFRPLRKKGTR